MLRVGYLPLGRDNLLVKTADTQIDSSDLKVQFGDLGFEFLNFRLKIFTCFPILVK